MRQKMFAHTVHVDCVYLEQWLLYKAKKKVFCLKLFLNDELYFSSI